ncbi:hypothetical protein E2C01_011137 [Portunus trituberculatus]|uniref:Uncharacterized protein n=1 Tax=Portunus trituberculatus TaxID=210409 RepID=A0A5B7DA87_PORTR|nr:hypothetical protein [Portunus trituberculatus]
MLPIKFLLHENRKKPAEKALEKFKEAKQGQKRSVKSCYTLDTYMHYMRKVQYTGVPIRYGF